MRFEDGVLVALVTLFCFAILCSISAPKVPIASGDQANVLTVADGSDPMPLCRHKGCGPLGK
jgi:hypothetical protein